MSKLISDNLLDSIQINSTPSEDSLRPILVEGSEEVLVITSTLGFFNWSEMNYIASGVHDRESIGINATGFRYPTDELDPEEEPLEGVEIYNPLGEVQVSIEAFENLMSRYFKALIMEAEKSGDSVIKEPWWPEFKALAEAINTQVSKQISKQRD